MSVFDKAWSVVKEERVYPRDDGWEEIDPRIPGTYTMGMLQVKNTLEAQMPEYEFKLINNHPHRAGAAYKILRRLRKDIGKSMELSVNVTIYSPVFMSLGSRARAPGSKMVTGAGLARVRSRRQFWGPGTGFPRTQTTKTYIGTFACSSIVRCKVMWRP